jgi:hypothetical protein
MPSWRKSQATSLRWNFFLQCLLSVAQWFFSIVETLSVGISGKVVIFPVVGWQQVEGFHVMGRE